VQYFQTCFLLTSRVLGVSQAQTLRQPDNDECYLLTQVLTWVRNEHARIRAALDPSSVAVVGGTGGLDALAICLDGIMHVLNAMRTTWCVPWSLSKAVHFT